MTNSDEAFSRVIIDAQFSLSARALQEWN